MHVTGLSFLFSLVSVVDRFEVIFFLCPSNLTCELLCITSFPPLPMPRFDSFSLLHCARCVPLYSGNYLILYFVIFFLFFFLNKCQMLFWWSGFLTLPCIPAVYPPPHPNCPYWDFYVLNCKTIWMVVSSQLKQALFTFGSAVECSSPLALVSLLCLPRLFSQCACVRMCFRPRRPSLEAAGRHHVDLCCECVCVLCCTMWRRVYRFYVLKTLPLACYP